MKLWNTNGDVITDANEIFNPWDNGVQYILLEDACDVRTIRTIYDRTRYDHINPDTMDKPGLYARREYDDFRYIAPVLK